MGSLSSNSQPTEHADPIPFSPTLDDLSGRDATARYPSERIRLGRADIANHCAGGSFGSPSEHHCVFDRADLLYTDVQSGEGNAVQRGADLDGLGAAANQTQGGGPLTLSYALAYVDFGLAGLLLDDAQRAQITRIVGGVKIDPAVVDLGAMTRLLNRKVSAINAGIACDPAGTRVALRADFDIQASPIAIDKTFFEAGPADLLAGKEWAMLMDAAQRTPFQSRMGAVAVVVPLEIAEFPLHISAQPARIASRCGRLRPRMTFHCSLIAGWNDAVDSAVSVSGWGVSVSTRAVTNARVAPAKNRP